VIDEPEHWDFIDLKLFFVSDIFQYNLIEPSQELSKEIGEWQSSLKKLSTT
jgi:hypothetical protein